MFWNNNIVLIKNSNNNEVSNGLVFLYILLLLIGVDREVDLEEKAACKRHLQTENLFSPGGNYVRYMFLFERFCIEIIVGFAFTFRDRLFVV